MAFDAINSVDLRPHRLEPLYDTRPRQPTPVMTVEDDKVVMLPTRTAARRLRTPQIYYYTPEQLEALVMLADEISFNVTHLNIGRETKYSMCHVGAVLKRDGKVLAHLDGLPAEFIQQPDGVSRWVPVGMGKKEHKTKLFCLTPATIERRRRLNRDHGVYPDVGSLNLSNLPEERRRLVAQRLRWAMEAINDEANINYIVPGGTTSQEIVHILLGVSEVPVIGNAAKLIVTSAARVKEIGDDVEDLARAAGQRMEGILSVIAGGVSGHRIVPDKDAAIHGCNSKDILLAVADVLERRPEVDAILDKFLASPGKENLRMPGGNSDVLREVLWLHAPQVWQDIEAQAKADRLQRHRESIAGMGRLAAAGAMIAFVLQSGGQAHALEGLRIAQQRVGDSGDPLLAFRQAADTAVGAASAAAGAIQDPVKTFSNPWSAVSDIPVPGTGLGIGALASITLALYWPKRTAPDADKTGLTPAVGG